MSKRTLREIPDPLPRSGPLGRRRSNSEDITRGPGIRQTRGRRGAVRGFVVLLPHRPQRPAGV